MSGLEKMIMPYFREINQGKKTDEELEYMAKKFNDDVRRWLKARTDFDPKKLKEVE